MPDSGGDSRPATVAGALLGLAIGAVPIAAVVIHRMAPDVLVLRLVAVALVLLYASVLVQGLAEQIASAGTSEGFTLHFGHTAFIVLLGTTFAVWWGWVAAGAVFLFDGAWQVVASLAERRMFADGQEVPDDIRDTSTVVEGLNAFGFALHRRLQEGGNVLTSPLGLAAALAALLPGARGQTADEIRGLLGLDVVRDAGAGGVGRLWAELASRSVPDYVTDPEAPEGYRVEEREVFRLGLATGLFVDESYPLHAAYGDTLRDEFEAEVSPVSFADADGATALINGWVAERTGGRIKDLLSPGALAGPARMVLANAVYFLAEWRALFDEALTRPAPFHAERNGETVTIDVPTMHNEADYAYWSDDALGLEALSLDYMTGASMLVILPGDGGLAAAEEALNPALLTRVDTEARKRPVTLQMPRFSFRTTLSLGDVLRGLGLHSLFDPDAADFSGISPRAEGLAVGDLLHQSWIRVDEQGTEAAAASAMDLLGEAIEEEPPIAFVVDRPFLFLIRDHVSKAVLFQGRVADPAGDPDR